MESILSKIAEYTIEPIGRLLVRQVGYVIHCKTNLQKLKDQVEELKAAREATENQVAEAKTKGEKIQPHVQLWLNKVGAISAQADELLNDESQAKLKCLHGFCPNLTVRHQLSRKSTKLVEEVVEHSGKRGLISQVACGNLRKEVWDITSRDYHVFESRMSKVKEIMDHLKDSKTERMGVYGMGGVGKTTLVKEIYKQASEDKKVFDDVVILLDVKKNPDLEAIQKIIVEKLGMEILQNETKEGRASRLCGRIQDKKVLVILDDVQEKIDLEAVGLPSLPTCKILLTCRTPEVFDEMRVDKVFRLDLLDKQDSWNLFAKMAGDVINQNGGIRDVAIEVAERCGGLPLLVVTVASALKDKIKLHAWKDALRRLKGFDKEELTEKAYLALEWSYDQLDDKELKPLFLLSGIIVIKNNINVQDLLKYGMGLSLFKNVNTVAEARDALDTLLEKLKDSCLLLDSDTEGFVRMHDLVIHVANRIACRDQHALSVEYGGELKEWPNKDFLRKCTKISLPLLNNIPTLSEIPLECPNLELFYLQRGDDNSVEMPSNFFREMQKLKVLDLTRMCMPSLPSSLLYLKKLQTLCLDSCVLGDITLLGQLSNLEILSLLRSNVKELPKEIRQLTRLRLLDLSNCSQLEVISPTVISSLVRLEDLRMRNSFNKWEVEGEGSNASLSELQHLSELSALEIHIPNADVLPANLFSHKLERFNIFIGDSWVRRYSWDELIAATTLNRLKLKLTKSIKELDDGLKLLLKRSEDLSLDEMEVDIVRQLDTEGFEHLKHLQVRNSIGFIDIINRKVVFPNLSTLTMDGCDNLRFLFSVSLVRSLVQLTQLKISSCKLMQEIVSSTRECGEVNMDNMFSKLKVLNLGELPNLVRFGPFSTGNYIKFSSLEELEIEDCDELVEFIGVKVAVSSKDTRICKEIELRVSEEEEKLDVKSETLVQKLLFNEKVVFPNLSTLRVHGCDNLRFLFSFSMTRSLVQLTQLAISSCKLMQEIVSSTRESGEANMDNMFSKLKVLNLEKLPNLVRFGTGNYIEFSSLEELEIEDCDELVEFIGVKVAVSSKDTRICKEIELRVSEEEEKLDVKSETLVQKLLFNEKVVFPNLSTLRVHGCDNLRFLFSFSMTRSLVQLTQLEISSCKLMQEIVSSTRESGEANMDNMFSKLKVLNLEKLPNLVRFGTGNYIEFSSLEELEIEDCDELVDFIGDKVVVSSKDTIIRKEEDNHDVKSEIVVQYFLFNEKVGFPSLERLSIEGIRKVKAIWHVQLAQDSFRRLRQVEVQRCDNLISFFPPSIMGRLNALETLEIQHCKSLEVVFELLGGSSNVKETHVDTSSPDHDQLKPFDCQNLDSINIYKCDNLKNIFPASMARGLQQLNQLNVSDCSGIEEIICKEEEEEVLKTKPPQYVFPKVTSVALKDLPQLRRFYPRLHVSRWPLLKQMEMVRCDKVEIFAAKFSMFQEKYEMNSLMFPQPLFITNKDSFPNLEHLELSANEIWNGPAQSELVFGKLKSITFDGNCAPFSNRASILFIEGLPNLEKIEMRESSSSSEEIFVNRGISTSRGWDDDAVGSGTLPRVRILKLFLMDELVHLGNDNSQSAAAAAGPVLFPNLEILEVERCSRLKSLGSSSAISFRNLTTLTVFACHGLEYLTTYSVAKSLVQLTTLEVQWCKSILVIVASNDEDDAAAAAAAGNMNEIAFSRLQHLELYRLRRLQGFCSGNCTVKFPSSMATLDVFQCPIKLKISPDGVLLTEKDPEHQDEDETVTETEDEDETVTVTEDEDEDETAEILSQGPPAS